MKTIISKIGFAVVLVACLTAFFTGCKKDEISTDITLTAFGPTPALRGGELRFLGNRISEATAVILPGNVEVTAITVVSINEIKITIPQNTQEGIVRVVTPKGELSTKTMLTFLEPITIESVSPLTVKAGDQITIKGDYLNLIAEVIFMDGVTVDSAAFVSHSRDKIEVLVPLNAQSGILTLSNGAEIPAVVYSDDALTVALPTITSFAPAADVEPDQTLTITGTNFDLVESVILPNGLTPAFTVNSANTEITLTIPADIQDGNVALLAYSGVQVTAATPIAVSGFTVTSLAPAPVKNGNTLTINGTKLNLVTKINFPHAGDVTAFASQSATKIEVVVPTAAQSGDLTLTSDAGKTVAQAYTLVVPSISGPLSGVGGTNLTINGSDLDLIASVAFDGNSETVTVVSHSETQLVITIPNTVISNTQLVFTLANGATFSTGVNVTPTANPYITTMPSDADPGSTVTIRGGNFNLLTDIQLNGTAIQYSILNATTAFLIIPSNANQGPANLTLVSASASSTYTITITGTGPIVTPIWTGVQDMGSWSGYIQLNDASLFANVVVGDQIRVTVDPSSLTASSQGSFKNGSWGEIAPGTDYFGITGDFSLTVDAAILTQLQTNGMVIGGQQYVATQVSIVH